MQKLIQHLRQWAPLQEKGPLALGLSGGLDSMVLATALHQAEIPFRALHFNHNWRGADSKADQQFVADWCRDQKIPFTTRTWRSPKKTEVAARDARHRFFEVAAQKYSLTAILLAHHQDDLAETLMLQLLRGSGPEGLASLLPERTVGSLTLLRPLLSLSKQELLKFARAAKVPWHEDTSNADPAFTRNQVRLRLLPYLKKQAQRDPLPLLSRTADILALENDYWQTLLPEVMPQEVSVKSLRNQHPAYQRRYLLQWLRQRTSTAPSFDEVEAVRRLITQTSPAKINLKQARYCRRRAGKLFIESGS